MPETESVVLGSALRRSGTTLCAYTGSARPLSLTVALILIEETLPGLGASRSRYQAARADSDDGRPERKKVMALARAREIEAILVTELSRWDRSTQDLVHTLDDLHRWKVSVLAQNGLSFDLSTSTGKLMRTIMAGLAEFERDLIRERVKSGLAAARTRGVKLGRQHGQRPSDKKAKRVLALHNEGLSYRLIGRNVGLSKRGHGYR